jgi:hypothetical protein
MTNIEKGTKRFDIVIRLREGRTDGTDLRWDVTDVHREAADEIVRLRAALDRYGDHLYECEQKEGRGCSCGYD